MKRNTKAQQTRKSQINCCCTQDCPTSNQGSQVVGSKPEIIKPSLVSPELFEKLLHQPKNIRQQDLHYSRFKVYVILARFTGLRVNEVGDLTRAEIDQMLAGNVIQVKDSKRGKIKDIYLPTKARDLLAQCQDDLEVIFKKQKTLSGTPYARNFIRFVNASLKRSTEGSTDNVTGQSLRATYFWDLLEADQTLKDRLQISHSSSNIIEIFGELAYSPDRVEEAFQFH